MSTTGLPVFDTTVQESIRWLKGVMDQLHTDDRHLAYLALRGTLDANTQSICAALIATPADLSLAIHDGFVDPA